MTASPPERPENELTTVTDTGETTPAAAEPPEETSQDTRLHGSRIFARLDADGSATERLKRDREPVPGENDLPSYALGRFTEAHDRIGPAVDVMRGAARRRARDFDSETRASQRTLPPEAVAEAERRHRARQQAAEVLEPLPPRQEEAFGALYAEENPQEPAAGQPGRRGPAAVVPGARALLGRVRRGPARKYPRGPVGRLLAQHDAEERAIRAAYAPPEPQQLPTGAPRFTAAPLPRPYIAPPAFSPSALPVKVWELAMEPPPDEEDPATAQLRAVQETPEETGYAGE